MAVRNEGRITVDSFYGDSLYYGNEIFEMVYVIDSDHASKIRVNKECLVGEGRSNPKAFATASIRINAIYSWNTRYINNTIGR